MTVRSILSALAIWLGIAAFVRAIGHFIFAMNFWVVAGLTIFSLFVNGLIIEWEDRQAGGWGNP